MKSECVLYQSAMLNNLPYQQLSNLVLSGFSTIANALNHDNGKLYGSLTKSGSSYTVQFYNDMLKTNLVASGSTSSALPQAITLSAQNESGLSGAVNLAQYTADDSLLVAQCLLSVDDPDLQLANLETLTDYDPTFGFAVFHIKAFDKIKEIVKSRFRSVLWNPNLIDTNYINGGVGGYDLSKVQTWEPLREASAYYALSLICDRQSVEPDGVFAKRGKTVLNIFRGHMEDVELAFDLSQQRIPEKTRTLRTFKVSRA